MERTRMNIHIKTKIHEKLSAYAESQGLSRTAAIEEILNNALSYKEKSEIIAGYIKFDVLADLNADDECDFSCGSDLSHGAFLGISGDGQVASVGVCLSCAGL